MLLFVVVVVVVVVAVVVIFLLFRGGVHIDTATQHVILTLFFYLNPTTGFWKRQTWTLEIFQKYKPFIDQRYVYVYLYFIRITCFYRQENELNFTTERND